MPTNEKNNKSLEEIANENIWDSLRTDKKKRITFGSLVKWAKDDNLEEYEKLFGKQIDWDIFTSEAGFAKTFKKIIFQDKVSKNTKILILKKKV